MTQIEVIRNISVSIALKHYVSRLVIKMKNYKIVYYRKSLK